MIKTERLELHPLGPQFLQTAHIYASDIENTRFMAYLPNETTEETADFLAQSQKEWNKANPQFFEFAILLDGEHIGAANAYLQPDGDSAEVGWILGKAHWGHGYATEAARAVMNYIAQRCGIRRFIAHCDSENVGSYRVMEKLGMQFVCRCGGRKNRSSDEERDELLYEIRLPESGETL